MNRRMGTSTGRWRSTLALVAAVGSAPLLAMACGNANPNTFENTTSGSGAGNSNGTGTGTTGSGGEGGSIFDNDAGPLVPIDVQPHDPTMKVMLPSQGQTVKFSCIDTATNLPVADAKWSIDTPKYGTIDANGVFTPNGLWAGKVTATCKSGENTATSTLTLTIHAIDGIG